MPRRVEVKGPSGHRVYRFVKLFKHDFFAATGLYEEGDTRRLAVLKIQRTYPLFGLPMRWLGARVAGHETGVLERLQGIAGVPDYLGRWGTTGFLHAFVPGEPLRGEMAFTPQFFQELRELLAAIHGRHVAYVDTNKRENILMGEDGHPWLIDFQISFWAKKGERDNFLALWALRRLQRADWYHFYKHKTRLLPGACTPEEFAAAQRRGFLHTLHRLVAQPLIRLRRRFLTRYALEKTK